MKKKNVSSFTFAFKNVIHDKPSTRVNIRQFTINNTYNRMGTGS